MDIFDTFSRSSQKFISVAKDYILPSKFNSVHNFLGSNINISFLQRPLFPYYFHYGHFLTSSTIIPCHKISQRKDHSSPFSFPKTAKKKKGGKKKQKKITIRRYRSRGFTFKSHSGMAFPVTLFIPLLPTS